MPVLLLRLAAPLQSWGVESKFDTRRTLGYPTKSGVIGLVASAMGRERTEPLDDLNELEIGIRVDNEGRQIRDYHTANGEKTKKYITHRFYLSDATFLVGLEHEDAGFIEKIEDALKHPAFPLFLGRRSCPPTPPLVWGLRDGNLLDVLKSESPLIDKQQRKNADTRLRIITESEDGPAIIKDVPVSFDPTFRRFGLRKIKDCYVEIDKPDDTADMVPTEHDPMAELR